MVIPLPHEADTLQRDQTFASGNYKTEGEIQYQILPWYVGSSVALLEREYCSQKDFLEAVIPS